MGFCLKYSKQKTWIRESKNGRRGQLEKLTKNEKLSTSGIDVKYIYYFLMELKEGRTFNCKKNVVKRRKALTLRNNTERLVFIFYSNEDYLVQDLDGWNNHLTKIWKEEN